MLRGSGRGCQGRVVVVTAAHSIFANRECRMELWREPPRMTCAPIWLSSSSRSCGTRASLTHCRGTCPGHSQPVTDSDAHEQDRGPREAIGRRTDSTKGEGLSRLQHGTYAGADRAADIERRGGARIPHLQFGRRLTEQLERAPADHGDSGGADGVSLGD